MMLQKDEWGKLGAESLLEITSAEHAGKKRKEAGGGTRYYRASLIKEGASGKRLAAAKGGLRAHCLSNIY